MTSDVWGFRTEFLNRDSVFICKKKRGLLLVL
jgi:hypothetical protein